MPDDLDTLQGTWTVTALQVDGRKMPPEALADASIVIKGRKFTSFGMGAEYAGTIELGQTKKPKTFDLLFTRGHATGTRQLGIYKLDDGKWTICLATRGEKRPATFATKADTGLALETLKRGGAAARKTARQKPPPLRRIEPTPTAAVSGDATELEGEWAMIGGVLNGAVMSAAMAKWCQRITRGDVTTVLAGPQVMLKARFTLDASRTPKAIDYVNLEGPQARKPQAGIFELKGDSLRICMSAPGKARPGEFASKAGDGRSFTSWRLARP
jgi:uncharacterized protein (TIGR03067 family)